MSLRSNIIRAILMTVAVAVPSIALAPAASASPSAASFTIVLRHPEKCLAVQGGSFADGAAVVAVDCHAGVNQRFRMVPDGSGFTLVALHSGKCVTAVLPGPRVVQWSCGPGANRFTLIPTTGAFGMLAAQHSGTCLTGRPVTVGDHLAVVLLHCLGAANQEFELVA
jgi:hypothetical protein